MLEMEQDALRRNVCLSLYGSCQHPRVLKAKMRPLARAIAAAVPGHLSLCNSAALQYVST